MSPQADMQRVQRRGDGRRTEIAIVTIYEEVQVPRDGKLLINMSGLMRRGLGVAARKRVAGISGSASESPWAGGLNVIVCSPPRQQLSHQPRHSGAN